MKWEPYAAMILVIALGLWLVTGPGKHLGVPDLRTGAEIHELRIGPTRGLVEIVEAGNGMRTYRILFRDGTAIGPLTDDEFIARYSLNTRDALVTTGFNPLFRLFNITSWAGLVWVGIGLGGQVAFFGRMAVQWLVSERERKSVVPPIFWYLSLFGGVALFTYFVWRQDFVGVLGQSTGVVIYARNIRLLKKQRRREAREAAKEAGAVASNRAEPPA